MQRGRQFTHRAAPAAVDRAPPPPPAAPSITRPTWVRTGTQIEPETNHKTRDMLLTSTERQRNFWEIDDDDDNVSDDLQFLFNDDVDINNMINTNYNYISQNSNFNNNNNNYYSTNLSINNSSRSNRSNRSHRSNRSNSSNAFRTHHSRLRLDDLDIFDISGDGDDNRNGNGNNDGADTDNDDDDNMDEDEDDDDDDGNNDGDDDDGLVNVADPYELEFLRIIGADVGDSDNGRVGRGRGQSQFSLSGTRIRNGNGSNEGDYSWGSGGTNSRPVQSRGRQQGHSRKNNDLYDPFFNSVLQSVLAETSKSSAVTLRKSVEDEEDRLKRINNPELVPRAKFVQELLLSAMFDGQK